MTLDTDDDLGRLLVDTFASREPLAEPAAAREIVDNLADGALADRARRGRWPAYLAAAAAVCAVAVASTFALSGHPSEPAVPNATASLSPPSPSGTQRAPMTYAANRAAAAAESARVVQLLRLPAGASRLATRPRGWPGDTQSSLEPSDRTLTRTAWWSVPMGASTLRTYLLDHSPAGMKREDGVGGDGDGIHDVTYDEASPQPASYIGVSLLVQWKEVDGRSVLRADTFTAARAIRNPQSFVTGAVTSVDLRRVTSSLGDRSGRALAPVHLTEPADHAAIAELVHGVNSLRASVRPAFYPSCPYPGDRPPGATITFRTTDGTVSIHLQEWCLTQVEVRRDGRLLNPSLEPGRLINLVDHLIGPTP